MKTQINKHEKFDMSDTGTKKIHQTQPSVIKGVIVHGKGHGAKHDMPTANLEPECTNALPKNGVYATLMNIDGIKHIGVTNIGLRPSDDDRQQTTIETILLNFNDNIYGKKVELEIWKFLRYTKKFDGGLDELKEQIKIDKQKAKQFFGESGLPN